MPHTNTHTDTHTVQKLRDLCGVLRDGGINYSDCCLRPASSHWRCFERDFIGEEKGDSLDISWIKDD